MFPFPLPRRSKLPQNPSKSSLRTFPACFLSPSPTFIPLPLTLATVLQGTQGSLCPLNDSDVWRQALRGSLLLPWQISSRRH